VAKVLPAKAGLKVVVFVTRYSTVIVFRTRLKKKILFALSVSLKQDQRKKQQIMLLSIKQKKQLCNLWRKYNI
jgi:hypothetical protein